MARDDVSRWVGDELDPSGAGQHRAKVVVRRTPARWHEREGVFHASVGRWSVRVAQGPDTGAPWEWSAFSQAAHRALRCTGFADREAAQRDAEATLAARE